MRRIVEESSQNVNSNAGIFLAKQIPDDIPSFGKFDSGQPSPKSVACQAYANSQIAKAEVALTTLGKTPFCDIAAHQKDDLFADAIGGAVPSEPTFRQRLAYLAILPDTRKRVDDANVELLSRVKDFGLVKTAGEDLPGRIPDDQDPSRNNSSSSERPPGTGRHTRRHLQTAYRNHLRTHGTMCSVLTNASSG